LLVLLVLLVLVLLVLVLLLLLVLPDEGRVGMRRRDEGEARGPCVARQTGEGGAREGGREGGREEGGKEGQVD